MSYYQVLGQVKDHEYDRVDEIISQHGGKNIRVLYYHEDESDENEKNKKVSSCPVRRVFENREEAKKAVKALSKDPETKHISFSISNEFNLEDKARENAEIREGDFIEVKRAVDLS